MTSKKLVFPLAALALVLSAGGGAVALAHADTGTTTTPAMTPVGGVAGAHDHRGGPHGHAPLGHDGVVASISGTTITMTEESNEGGASYTVDASAATVMKNGVASSVSGIAVGDKIFVKGTVTGTNVVATKIMDGHGPRGLHSHHGNKGPVPPASATPASSSAIVQ